MYKNPLFLNSLVAMLYNIIKLYEHNSVQKKLFKAYTTVVWHSLGACIVPLS